MDSEQGGGEPAAGERAIFLSYASEDAELAGRICSGLRAGGIEVWYDRSELRGGDAWDAAIRHQIKACALFIPVISANSQARSEGYFRLEWKLAIDRSHLMAQDRAFLVPVVIDATQDRAARVPDRFREVQWTRLPGGQTPPAFVERIRRLLAASEGCPLPAAPERGAADAVPASSRGPSGRRWAQMGLVAAAIAAGYFAIRLFPSAKPSPDAPSRSSAPIARSSPAAAISTGAAIPDKSIAVLPFADLSEKHDQEYFSDGLSEELINELSKVTDLRVPGRISSFYFKGKSDDVAAIARKLRVAHLLEGTVRRSGNMVRVSAELIQADSGYDLWSQTYDQPVKDIFQVQDQIASAVVSALKARLLETRLSDSGHRTSNSEAYDAYLAGNRARAQYTGAGFEQALRFYHQAIALDSNFAAAYAGLAMTEAQLADLETGDAAALQRARDAADRAIALAPDMPDGYAVRGWLRDGALWDWSGARADIEKALALDPGNAQALLSYDELLVSAGDLPQALAVIRKVVAVDPLSESARNDECWVHEAEGDFAAARQACLAALQLAPTHYGPVMGLARCDLYEGHPEQAIETAEHMGQIADVERESLSRQFRALAYFSLGRRAESHQALEGLIARRSRTMAYQIAEIYAWCGETDDAFHWLDRAYEQHDGGLSRLATDRMMRSIHGDPRYPALLRKLGLPSQV